MIYNKTHQLQISPPPAKARCLIRSCENLWQEKIVLYIVQDAIAVGTSRAARLQIELRRSELIKTSG
jgi:hypothetical protein